MKIRYGQLLNDLNISLDTAIKRLKRAGILRSDKNYTLNAIVSDSEYNLLKAKDDNGSKVPSRKKKPTVNSSKSNSNKALSYQKMVTAPCGFSSCYAYFILKASSYKKLADIKEEMNKVFGEDIKAADLKLARLMNSKGINVTYKYYYYSKTGRKSYIKDDNKCLLTWIASVFSEAVNKELITKVDYHLFYKTYLAQEFESKKKKRRLKAPKMSKWVSVVSVPFGGMNRR